MTFNIDLFKKICLEDFDKKFKLALHYIEEYKDNKLFNRLLSTDRQILYSIFNKLINTNYDIRTNRDELSFIVETGHFISGYIMDDAECSVYYKVYSPELADFIDCDKSTPLADSYLDIIRSDYDKVFYEEDIIALIEEHEKNELEYYVSLHESFKDDYYKYNPEYIDYHV